MQSKTLIPIVLIALVLLASIPLNALAQGVVFVQISNVNATARVTAGQPLTVSITVSYRLITANAEDLLIVLLDHTENGNPFPTTANSCDSTSEKSICDAQTQGTYGIAEGDYTATFTIIAPQPKTWVIAVAYIIQLDLGSSGYKTVASDYKVVPVTITAP